MSTLHPLFVAITDSIRSGMRDAAEINRIADRLMSHQPVYWPENFDEHHRHIITEKKDWDTCDNCGTFDEVAYWFGGASVDESGTVKWEPQLPLCARCQPK